MVQNSTNAGINSPAIEFRLVSTLDSLSTFLQFIEARLDDDDFNNVTLCMEVSRVKSSNELNEAGCVEHSINAFLRIFAPVLTRRNISVQVRWVS